MKMSKTMGEMGDDTYFMESLGKASRRELAEISARQKPPQTGQNQHILGQDSSREKGGTRPTRARSRNYILGNES